MDARTGLSLLKPASHVYKKDNDEKITIPEGSNIYWFYNQVNLSIE